MQNKIINKIYIKGILTLKSPMIIGSGNTNNSDIDIIRDSNGAPFIPGTSLAGVLRSKSKDYGISEDKIKEIFGNDRQSMIMVYDCNVVDDYKIVIRDGIQVDCDKRTAKDKSKYDYEILEPGCKIEMKLEMSIREKNDKDSTVKAIQEILWLLENEKITLGAKSRRGFGKVQLEEIFSKQYDLTNKEQAEKWIEFEWEKIKDKELKSLQPINSNLKFKEIEVKYNIPYSILIRHYNANPNDEDATHIQSNEKSVITGTAFTGLIRNSIHNISEILNKKDEIEKLCDYFMGYVQEEDKKKNIKKEARASKITIEESEIINGKLLSQTRNKIDRFTGGTIDGALFDEKSSFGGTTKLSIKIKKEKDYEAFIGLLCLVFKEIDNGISTIGGAVNIGRGILKESEKNISEEEEKKYISAFAKYLNAGGNNE